MKPIPMFEFECVGKTLTSAVFAMRKYHKD